jgi:hypothetical protein
MVIILIKFIVLSETGYENINTSAKTIVCMVAKHHNYKCEAGLKCLIALPRKMIDGDNFAPLSP